MSINSKIELETINYAYDTHTFISSGKTITSTENNPIKIKALIDGYTSIFSEGMEDKKALLDSLSGILDIASLTIEKINENDFYSEAKTISGKTIDSNCLEGYRAYSFYLEKIILLLNKLDDAIKQGQAVIEQISTLTTDGMSADQTVDEYVNSKVHELSAELYLADKAIADVMSEFESCLKYNADTKSWDTSSYSDSQLSCITREQKLKIVVDGEKYDLTFNHLRGLNVNITDTGKKLPTHEIACFSELNLLDRLCYIRYYYELILNKQDKEYQIFPNDPEKGYPCIPNKESNRATHETESMGGFELFYVGYLVDRDGSIDAYSSCLEAKSKAITDNISLQSENIESYNQYLAFINRGMQLFTSSQGGDKPAPIPGAASVALSYLCGGSMRDLVEIDGVKYIVIPATNIYDEHCEYTVQKEANYYEKTEEGTDFKYNASHIYMLVRADDKGMKAFLGDKIEGDESNGWFNTIDINTILANDASYTAQGASAKQGERFCVFVDYGFEFNKISNWTSGSFDKKKEWLELKTGDTGILQVFYDNCTEKMDNLDNLGGEFYYCKHDSNSATNKEIIIWDLSGNSELKPNDDERFENRQAPTDLEKQYLPTLLRAEEIIPQSVAAYDHYRVYSAWGKDDDGEDSGEKANRVINSWTTAFSNKSEYINTAIETINTDITALRTKMDTLDSLCSTLRNRSFETKKTLISNLRS